MTVEEQWPRFTRLIRQNAPTMPGISQTRTQERRQTAGQAANMISGLLDGLGVELPGVAGVAVSAATSDDPADFANAMADTAVTTGASTMLGAEAGPLVGGVIMIMRGAHQSLSRSDEMVTYLLGIGGYVNALARLSLASVQDAVPYTRPITNPVPSYIQRQGDLFSSWRREAWVHGVNRTASVVREMDTIRPVQGDHYSKQCLIQLAVNTNMAHYGEGLRWRLRIAVENQIVNDILRRNLNSEREQMRRWANSP